LFIKFYYIPDLLYPYSPFTVAKMPGLHEGVSGTVLVGYNVGIVGNVDKKKIGPAVEAIRFMTSREMQVDLVMREYIISGITSLYEDPEICSNIRFCDFYRYSQTTTKPKNVFNSDYYYDEFTNYFYYFLYGDESAKSVLQKMEDLTKIYSVSFISKETNVGLILSVIYISVIVIVLISLVLLFIPKYNKLYLYFLPKPYWFLVIFGVLIILSSGFTKLGEISPFKCHLNHFLLSLGYTFSYVPFLYKMVITFPDDNKYSSWVEKNNVLFFSLFIIADLVLNSISLINHIDVKNVFINEGKIYQICDTQNNILVKLIVYIVIIYKLVLSLIMLLLTFLEWSIIKIKVDIRLILASLYLNIMTYSIYILVTSFQFNDYVLYYVIQEVFLLLIAVVNFILLYLIRLLIPVFNKEDEDANLFEHFESTTNKSTTQSQSQQSQPDKSNNTLNRKTSKMSDNNSILFKMLHYHKMEFTSADALAMSNNFKSDQISVNKSDQVTLNKSGHITLNSL